MIPGFKSLREWWSNWCGDREMEIQIQTHLNQNGYFGRSAQFSRVKLVATERPGWVQVYRFDVKARARPLNEANEDAPDPEPVYHELFGLLKDDARGSKTQIQLMTNREQRQELYEAWTEGMIRSRRGLGA